MVCPAVLLQIPGESLVFQIRLENTRIGLKKLEACGNGESAYARVVNMLAVKKQTNSKPVLIFSDSNIDTAPFS